MDSQTCGAEGDRNVRGLQEWEAQEDQARTQNEWPVARDGVLEQFERDFHAGHRSGGGGSDLVGILPSPVVIGGVGN